MSADANNLLEGTYRAVAAVLGWEKALAFGSKVWEAKRPPSRLKPGNGRGGLIYIPKTLNGRVGTGLIEMLSIEDATKLVRIFGGNQLEFGRPCNFGRGRDEVIASNVREGWSVQHVAVLFDLEERQVRRICTNHDVSAKASLPKMRDLRRCRREGVRKAVIEAYRAGTCVERAAYEWGFMPDVAHAILSERPE